MNYCEAMNAYATNADWITHGALLLLGFWKFLEILGVTGRWIERKIHGWITK